MLLKRLAQVCQNRQLPSVNQAGFTPHRGTIEQVARFTQDVKDGFQHKQSTLAVFVDFRAAFDKVWRRKLLTKLLRAGIHGKMYKAIASFLAQRLISVKYKEARSTFRQTKQGLPQGSVISPFLFNLMIDDVIEKLQQIPGLQALLYADDLVIWATSSNIKALETCLSGALDLLHTWATDNEMQINADKTEFQLFSLSTKPHQLSLSYDSHPLTRTSCATYLGVHLDTKLQWNNHIEHLADTGGKRLALIRRLAGTKWGASLDVLTQAYSGYVRPAMEYGGELITSASQTALKKLDRVQNQALRLITGAPRSTPIPSMEIQVGADPLSIRRDMAMITLNERIQRLGIDHWARYSPAQQRLKTQGGFITTVSELHTKYDLDVGSRKPFLRPFSSYGMHTAVGCLKLIDDVSKVSSPDYELRAVALKTIDEWYPTSSWTHVYTDGSAINATSNAGAGVFSANFQLSAPVGKMASNFDGEVAAVTLALEQLQTQQPSAVVIFVDSQAAIIALTTLRDNDTGGVLSCRALLSNMISIGWRVVIQWIPSHCGIRGNDEADRLAKEGCRKEQPDTPIEYGAIKRVVNSMTREIVKKRHDQLASGKQWAALQEKEGRIPADLKRKEFVACFRLTTGHDYLQAHLFKIGVKSSPDCPLCGIEPMTGTHLQTCSELFNDRQVLTRHSNNSFKKLANLYWAARYKMANSQ